MPKDTERKWVKAHLDPELHARLAAYATETRRSMTKAAEYLIERALDAHDAENARNQGEQQK